ncbi:metallophosphatase family protein [Paenibacillus doosanensis]|uniref:Phosphodiesterase n=1 Tax=Paenibacillus konkukensis TaxID=2020716 RepID=A0ABY4RU93_9BACL|nr:MULTISPECIES: metallophosphoesterase family protein [Paenibacillus]MCS7461249.1 metallophosphatase family protein [Paenibacillus doosanensis]UQZ85309.1 phosphodiesterase [Paenibacillus konkukensis]
MRLAVISDTHGNAVAFEAVIRDLRRQSPDAVVFLGDLVMRGPQPAECLELLDSLNPLAVIKGNHDHYFAKYPDAAQWIPKTEKERMNLRQLLYNKQLLSEEQQRYLGCLPVKHLFREGDFQAELYHAAPDSLGKITWPWSLEEELDSLHTDSSTKMVLYGHIHHAYTRNAFGRQIVNCGSVGLPFDGDARASYAIVDIAQGQTAVQIRRIEYDIERVIRIAKERSMPDTDLFERAVRTARFAYSFKQPV